MNNSEKPSLKISDMLFSLLRSELSNEGTDISCSVIGEEDALKIVKLAEKHDVAHLAVDAIRKNKLLSDEGGLRRKMDEVLYKALFRDKNNNDMLEKAEDALGRNGIEFIPLKGTVARELYSKRWMRSGCDVDILVREDALEKALDVLTAEGFESDRKKRFHDVDLYYGNAHLELHHSVCENIPSIDGLLGRIWEFSERKNGYEYAETRPFFVFHHIAHMSYHFLKGGCGIKPFMDLWLMRKKRYYDEAEAKKLCKECGLSRFYDCCCELADVWFDDKERTGITEKMEEYILTGGVYGSYANMTAAGAAKDNGKLRHMKKKLFPPFSSMKKRYCWLEKKPFLLPAGYLLRLTDKFLGKDKRKTGKKIASLKKSNIQDIKTVSDLLYGVGLIDQEEKK